MRDCSALKSHWQNQNVASSCNQEDLLSLPYCYFLLRALPPLSYFHKSFAHLRKILSLQQLHRRLYELESNDNSISVSGKARNRFTSFSTTFFLRVAPFPRPTSR